MQSQRYRDRITFQEPITTRDSVEGAEETSWVTVALETGEFLEDVPAEVLTGPGREFLQSGQIQGEVAARISCRWFPGLNQVWRILWNGITYDIGAWDEDRTHRREYRIRVTGGVNNG